MSAIRGDARARSAGFSLVEMLAVVVILALAMATVSFSLRRGSGRSSVATVAAEAAGLARAARHQAVRTGRGSTLRIDLERRTLSVEASGRRLVVPDAMELEVTSSTFENRSRGEAGVRFFPDGSSTGATIRLGSARDAHEVRINWFTGRVSVVPPT